MGVLDGQVAIVTGAGQGIGRGIAMALAGAGARVLAASRTASRLEETCRLIGEAGGTALPLAVDVCDADAASQISDETVRQFGAIDILVNNAQQAVLGPLLELDDAGYDLTFRSGPLAAFRLMKACHPHMKAQGGGSIVNLASSVAVAWDSSGAGIYGSMKQAIRTLGRAAASEWGPDGIRVNTIAPLAASPSLKGWLDQLPEGPDAYIQTIPLRRIGDPETDIGEAVVFLASPQSRYITGATIPIDGGQANFG